MNQQDLQHKLYRELLGDFSPSSSCDSSSEEDWLAESFSSASEGQTVAVKRHRLTELDFDDIR